MVDAVTRAWIIDASDELAIRNGCWFDPLAGSFAVWWIERYCRLYEGEWAGYPMHLRGRHDEAVDEWEIPEEFSETIALKRHEHFVDGMKSGIPCDWQYFALMRLFGWKRESRRWGRPVRRFRQGSIWVPKKNKKSPTLAAIGLYLTCGDGEQGQKVAFAAKDGSQARDIAGKHAIEMVNASPELRAECKVNLNEMQVEHIASRSFMKPFSSSNSRTQQAKEGFNGSILVDETHVVDRAFMKRLSRAGISRSEPIQLEVSTAGNNPEGYGKERFDFGADIASGAVENDQLCYIAYAASQDSGQCQFTDDRVLSLGRQANPAWGHTIGEEEYLADWNQSKSKPGDLADFLMYRLNVWQSSSNPFLPAGAWSACYEGFSEEELLGESCYGGLDLSLKWDTTALVLLFPGWDGECEVLRMLCRFWLPENTVHRQKNLVAWEQWAQCGAIKVTSGNVTDFSLIKQEIVELSQKYRIQSLGYDERFAHILCQDLQDNHGINVSPFGQSAKYFGGPMDLLSAMVASRKLRHNGNPVMTWQMGNLAFKEVDGAKKPVRPDASKHLKIDGPLSLLMSLGEARFAEQEVESEFGFEFIDTIG